MYVNSLPGVVASTTAARKHGPSKTVGSIFKMEQYLVTFYDEQGDEHVDVLIKIGDKLYASRNGEAWCKGLAPAAPWLAGNVAERIATKAQDVFVPVEDSVNVTGSQISRETQKILGSR